MFQRIRPLLFAAVLLAVPQWCGGQQPASQPAQDTPDPAAMAPVAGTPGSAGAASNPGSGVPNPSPVDEAIAVRMAIWDSQAAWNAGDMQRFLRCYKDSPHTRMIGSRTYQGFAAVAAHYRKEYPNQDKMGQLAFSMLDVKLTGPTSATVTGHFHLERSAPGGGDADGNFELQMEKTADGWKIVQDQSRP